MASSPLNHHFRPPPPVRGHPARLQLVGMGALGQTLFTSTSPSIHPLIPMHAQGRLRKAGLLESPSGPRNLRWLNFGSLGTDYQNAWVYRNVTQRTFSYTGGQPSNCICTTSFFCGRDPRDVSAESSCPQLPPDGGPVRVFSTARAAPSLVRFVGRARIRTEAMEAFSVRLRNKRCRRTRLAD